MVKVATTKSPIRGNLKFSPSPKPTKSRVKKTPALKRKSLTLNSLKPVRSRARKVKGIAQAKENEKKEDDAETSTELPQEENVDGTFIVRKDTKKRTMPKLTTPIKEENSPVKKRTRPVRGNAKPAEKITPVLVLTPVPTKAKQTKKPPRAKKASKTTVIEPELAQPEDTPKPEAVDHQINFNNFKFTRLIDDSSRSKTITFLGFYEGKETVIKLEKTSFHEDPVKEALLDQRITATRDFNNDIYSSYTLSAPHPSINTIKATVVCPANEKVLAKYSKSETVFFSENADTYLKIVEPFVNDLLEKDPDYNNWVYNILDGKSERERVIYDDPDKNSGFVIVPDLKWHESDKEVYLLAISRKRGIKSLRDLTDEHLILLKNILTKGTKAIKTHFKNSHGQLRAYIHYQPSFYHFHVHFKMVDPGDYSSTDRDHLLGTVINNISESKDYYKKAPLIYPLSKANLLYKELEKAGRV